MNINQQYEIYKPLPNQNDIIQSLIIKNGEINKLPKPKKMGYLDTRGGDKKFIYKDGYNYYTYNYDLDIMTALLIATRKGNIDIIKLLLNSKEINIEIQSIKYYKSSRTQKEEFFTIQEKDHCYMKLLRVVMLMLFKFCHLSIILIVN